MSPKSSDDVLKDFAAALYSEDPRGVLGPWVLASMVDALFMVC